jgi:hypothetical protein
VTPSTGATTTDMPRSNAAGANDAMKRQTLAIFEQVRLRMSLIPSLKRQLAIYIDTFEAIDVFIVYQ